MCIICNSAQQELPRVRILARLQISPRHPSLVSMGYFEVRSKYSRSRKLSSWWFWQIIYKCVELSRLWGCACWLRVSITNLAFAYKVLCDDNGHELWYPLKYICCHDPRHSAVYAECNVSSSRNACDKWAAKESLELGLLELNRYPSLYKSSCVQAMVIILT